MLYLLVGNIQLVECWALKLFLLALPKDSRADELNLMTLLSVSLYLDCFLSVRLCLILLKLGTNDEGKCYTVTVQILTICINYAN